MKHLKQGRKFGRKRGPRRSFLRVLAGNMIVREKITTTEARAKEVSRIVERGVTYGKKQNLSGLRMLIKKLPRTAAYKIYHELAIKYKDRNGGYTRIIKETKKRQGDNAKMARIEFV